MCVVFFPNDRFIKNLDLSLESCTTIITIFMITHTRNDWQKPCQCNDGAWWIMAFIINKPHPVKMQGRCPCWWFLLAMATLAYLQSDIFEPLSRAARMQRTQYQHCFLHSSTDWPGWKNGFCYRHIILHVSAYLPVIAIMWRFCIRLKKRFCSLAYRCQQLSIHRPTKTIFKKMVYFACLILSWQYHLIY